MSASFLDTNILVYAYSIEDKGKWQTATELLGQAGHVSVQCLNEFASVARRKLGFDTAAITIASADITALCASVVPVTLDLHRRGLDLAGRYKLGIYDAMIVSAALAIDAGTLYSEDMHDGLVVDGVLTIRNPFA